MTQRSAGTSSIHSAYGVKVKGRTRPLHMPRISGRSIPFQSIPFHHSIPPFHSTVPVHQIHTPKGICFSGSNQISDYIGGGESQLCSDERGSYFGGQFVINVYHIDDVVTFQDSSTARVTCGKDYCSEPDLQSNLRLMCSVSSSHHILPTVSVILFLVLCLLLDLL